jgi:hypothetical protein
MRAGAAASKAEFLPRPASFAPPSVTALSRRATSPVSLCCTVEEQEPEGALGYPYFSNRPSVSALFSNRYSTCLSGIPTSLWMLFGASSCRRWRMMLSRASFL